MYHLSLKCIIYQDLCFYDGVSAECACSFSRLAQDGKKCVEAGGIVYSNENLVAISDLTNDRNDLNENIIAIADVDYDRNDLNRYLSSYNETNGKVTVMDFDPVEKILFYAVQLSEKVTSVKFLKIEHLNSSDFHSQSYFPSHVEAKDSIASTLIYTSEKIEKMRVEPHTRHLFWISRKSLYRTSIHKILTFTDIGIAHKLSKLDSNHSFDCMALDLNRKYVYASVINHRESNAPRYIWKLNYARESLPTISREKTTFWIDGIDVDKDILYVFSVNRILVRVLTDDDDRLLPLKTIHWRHRLTSMRVLGEYIYFLGEHI